jgi:hypothetical protein
MKYSSLLLLPLGLLSLAGCVFDNTPARPAATTTTYVAPTPSTTYVTPGSTTTTTVRTQ